MRAGHEKVAMLCVLAPPSHIRIHQAESVHGGAKRLVGGSALVHPYRYGSPPSQHCGINSQSYSDILSMIGCRPCGWGVAGQPAHESSNSQIWVGAADFGFEMMGEQSLDHGIQPTRAVQHKRDVLKQCGLRMFINSRTARSGPPKFPALSVR